MRNYKAYIGAAECYAATRSEAKDIETLLETLRAQLPSLRLGCEAFVKGAQEIAKARTMNRTLLNNSTTMGELLEIPKLLDACVRNGHYDEALDLENFVAKMETTHGHIGLIKTLADEARASSAEMLRALLGRLRVGIQLPECLRVIGYLRRLSAYDEMALRQTFLSCREEYIANAVGDLDDSNAYDYLKKLTDTHRVALFDVVMQYRAIFSDESASDTKSNAGIDGGSLLYSWATHRVSKYLALIEATLPRMYEGGALASVYEHCQYCGTSLARVGLDTRPLLRPLFTDAAVGIFDAALATAGDEFERALESATWTSVSTTPSSKPEGDDADDPPVSLLDFVPVATFTNGVLLAYNELRHLTGVLDVESRLAASLESTLSRAAATLLALSQAKDSVLRHDERKYAIYVACVRAFADDASTYLLSTFARLTPASRSTASCALPKSIRATLDPVLADAPA